LPMHSPLGRWGSAIGLLVIAAVVLKTWYDSRVNLITGLVYLIALTIAYFLLRGRRMPCERALDSDGQAGS
jgi:L-asparagine transporter-like permease